MNELLKRAWASGVTTLTLRPSSRDRYEAYASARRDDGVEVSATAQGESEIIVLRLLLETLKQH